MTFGRRRPRGTMLCALVAAGALLAGCGDDDKKAKGSGAPAAEKGPPIKADQPDARAGRPGEVVIRLWSRLREGMPPLALNAFDEAAVARVGRENFIGALGVAQGTAVGYAPTIVRTEFVERRRRARGSTSRRRERLALVHVKAEGKQGAISRSTFLLARTPAGWTIVFDTLVDASLRSFVTTSRQFAPENAERLPAEQAGQAGAAASRAYQESAAGVARGRF